MKYFGLLLLIFVFVSNRSLAQIQWKDSVVYKQKPQFAYKDKETIYFKTKKGWGVYYYLSKQVLIEPKYEFIKKYSLHNFTGYLYVYKGKVGALDSLGNQMFNPVYNSICIKNIADKNYFILNENWNGFKIDLETRWMKPFSLDDFSEVSVKVHNKLVVVNDFYHFDDPTPVQLLINDVFKDSIDSEGNTVYEHFSDSCHSGIFNIEKSVWQTKGFAKITVANNLLIARKKVFGKRFEDNILIIDEYGNSTNSFPFKERFKKKNVIKLIANNNFSQIDSIGSFTDLDLYYSFSVDNKTCFYHPYSLNFLFMDNKYDFIYRPNALQQFAFIVEKNKAGVYDLFNDSIIYSTDYNEILLIEGAVNSQKEIFASCGSSETELPFASAETKTNINGANPQYSKFYTHTGVQIISNKIVVNDYIPVGPKPDLPFFRFDEFGNQIDSVMHDKSGKIMTDKYGVAILVFPQRSPAVAKGSVYDLDLHKFIFPQKHSNIKITTNGYACNTIQDDSLFFSFYDNNGKSVYELIASSQFVNNATMVKKYIGENLINGNVNTNVIRLPKISTEYKMISRIADSKYYALFDFLNIKFNIPLVYSYIHFNSYYENYFLVDTNKLGFSFGISDEDIPAKYSSIILSNGYLFADDTLAVNYYSGEKLKFVDSTNIAVNLFNQAKYSNPQLEAKLLENNLLVKSVYFNPENTVYDDNFNVTDIVPYDEVFSANVDLKTKKESFLKGIWQCYAWDNGFIGTNIKGNFVYAVPGGETKLIFNSPDSVLRGNNTICNFVIDSSYAFTSNGTIVKPDKIDKIYFKAGNIPVGKKYNWYNGSYYSQPNANLIVQAMNTNGLILGYRIEPDNKKTNYLKKYYYYNTSDKNEIKCDLELNNGILNVYPIENGFVLINYLPATKKYHCLVMESDLKTVKSEFKDIVRYKTFPAYGFNAIPLYDLQFENEHMCFDKNFQFVFKYSKVDELKMQININHFDFCVGKKTYRYQW